MARRQATIGTILGIAALLLCAAARAQSVSDMSTYSCQDWLDASDDDQEAILVWLRGYLAGRSSSSLYDPQAVRRDRVAMSIYCRGHLTIGVISAMGQVGR